MEHTISPEEDFDYMESLQLAGQIIMENGGETYRAEETICRMGQGFGLNEVESFAVPSGLFVSYRNRDGILETGVRRVHREGRNLTRVNEANRVSRAVAAGKMKPAEALQELRRIAEMPGMFAGFWGLPAAFLCAGGFCALFGGQWLDLAIAGVVATVVQAASMLLVRFHMRQLTSAILGGFLTMLLPHLLLPLLPIHTEAVIAGAIMPLVPGLAMTNAVQDALRGDMVSALSHGLQALLTACLIAGGALLGSGFLRLVSFAGGPARPAGGPLLPFPLADEILRAAFGSFVGTVGFAMLVHVPRRSWWVAGLIAALAYLVSWGLSRLGCPEEIGIFCGALFGSLLGLFCARHMRMIGTVFLMSAIVPVVPGLSLYRMMAYLGQSRTNEGAALGVQAMITIAMIALGLGVGSFVDRLIHSRRHN